MCYCYQDEYKKNDVNSYENNWHSSHFSFVIITSTAHQTSPGRQWRKEKEPRTTTTMIRRSSLSIWEMLDWIRLYTLDTNTHSYAHKRTTPWSVCTLTSGTIVLTCIYISRHTCMHSFMCVKVDSKEKWSRCVVWLSWLSSNIKVYCEQIHIEISIEKTIISFKSNKYYW